MKILLFYRSLSQGGVQKMMIRLANSLSSRGFEVDLLLIRKEGELLDTLNRNIKIIELRKSGYLSLIPQLCHILKGNKYNILFTATPSLNIAAIVAKLWSRSKTKVFISERSDPWNEFIRTKWGIYKLSFLLIPIFYRYANHVIAVSKGVGSSIQKLGMISFKRITVIYNPAFDSQNIPHVNTSVNHKWLYKKDSKVIIAAGRLQEQKYFSLLINAFSIVAKEVDCKLIILGEGPLRTELQDQINRLLLSDKVDLVGFKINPIEWIYLSDVFVLSSKWEGFGNILIDALTAQTTIVSTNCKSGPSEILDNGNYGYMVNSFDDVDLAYQILFAIHNPIDQSKLLDRAKDFSEDKIVSEYIKLFTEIN